MGVGDVEMKEVRVATEGDTLGIVVREREGGVDREGGAREADGGADRRVVAIGVQFDGEGKGSFDGLADLWDDGDAPGGDAVEYEELATGPPFFRTA